MRILALGIYGLVLFPSAEGMIDFEVVNVFKNVVTLKINGYSNIGRNFLILELLQKSWKGSFKMLLAVIVCLDCESYD